VPFRLSHPGFVTLTTQLFVSDDSWIDSDVVGAVKPSLVIDFDRHQEPTDLREHGLGMAFPHRALRLCARKRSSEGSLTSSRQRAHHESVREPILEGGNSVNGPVAWLAATDLCAQGVRAIVAYLARRRIV
jgi:hypothetical protein